MALIKARTLAEFREGDEEVSGRATRSARRRYRKARREAKDRDKAAELRQKARALERGGKRRRKKRKGGKGGGRAEERGSGQPAGPRRFPGGFPGRGQGQRWSEQEAEAPAELEPVEPEDEADPEELFPEEEELGRGPLRRRSPSWGPLVQLGPNLRIQAAEGFRAAIISLRPGLYLVAELPEQSANTQLGLAPILAPLLLRSAGKALTQRPAEGSADAETTKPRGGLFTALTRRRDGRRGGQAEAEPAPDLGWADPEDVAQVLGCEVCEPRKR